MCRKRESRRQIGDFICVQSRPEGALIAGNRYVLNEEAQLSHVLTFRSFREPPNVFKIGT